MKRTPYRWYRIYKRYLEMKTKNKPHRGLVREKVQASKHHWGSAMTKNKVVTHGSKRD